MLTLSRTTLPFVGKHHFGKHHFSPKSNCLNRNFWSTPKEPHINNNKPVKKLANIKAVVYDSKWRLNESIKNTSSQLREKQGSIAFYSWLFLLMIPFIHLLKKHEETRDEREKPKMPSINPPNYLSPYHQGRRCYDPRG